MNVEELVKELEAQKAENQTLRNDLAKALERLEEANARIKQLEGQAAKDSHNISRGLWRHPGITNACSLTMSLKQFDQSMIAERFKARLAAEGDPNPGVVGFFKHKRPQFV
jgi:predicted nuclease with TOPRIM domain